MLAGVRLRPPTALLASAPGLLSASPNLSLLKRWSTLHHQQLQGPHPARLQAISGPAPRRTRRAPASSSVVVSEVVPPFAAPMDETTGAIDPATYEQQLERKISSTLATFSGKGIKLPEPRVFRSPNSHFRHKAEFRLWHQGTDCYFVMFTRVEGFHGPRRVRVDSFPPASALINDLMVALRRELLTAQVLRDKLYQVNLHTTLSGEALITLIYHRQLDAAWEEAAAQLQEQLRGSCGLAPGQPCVVGRSRRQKMAVGRDYLVERLSVAGREWTYRQPEGMFSQPNAAVCTHMLEWSQEVTQGADGSPRPGWLLELYCGNGNFTLPLSVNFTHVLATEVARAGAAAAAANVEDNGVNNIRLARMSAAEVLAAWKNKEKKYRLQGLDWEEVDFDTLVVDPPRCGLDTVSLQLLRDFPRVLYISCNPDTLARDLQSVQDSHKVLAAAFFDQFPYTSHLECGVYLQRRDIE